MNSSSLPYYSDWTIPELTTNESREGNWSIPELTTNESQEGNSLRANAMNTNKTRSPSQMDDGLLHIHRSFTEMNIESANNPTFKEDYYSDWTIPELTTNESREGNWTIPELTTNESQEGNSLRANAMNIESANNPTFKEEDSVSPPPVPYHYIESANNPTFKEDYYRPSDFEYLPKSDRAFIKDAYEVISKKELWEPFRKMLLTKGVQPVTGFMFSNEPLYRKIKVAIASTSVGGRHSGSSMGYVMREMEFIAVNGETAYRREVMKQNQFA